MTGITKTVKCTIISVGARCNSVVRAFAHGAMGRRIAPSWGGPIELFLVPASAPRLAYQRLWYVLSCLWDDQSDDQWHHVVAAAGLHLFVI